MQNPYGRHLLTILAGAVFTEPQVQVHLEVEQPQRGGRAPWRPNIGVTSW